MRVSVPQEAGEIVIRRNAREYVYPVKAGHAKVPEDQLKVFLRAVKGSAVAQSTQGPTIDEADTVSEREGS